MTDPNLDLKVRAQLDNAEASVEALAGSMAALVEAIGETSAWSSVAVRYHQQVRETNDPTHVCALASAALIRIARGRCTRDEAVEAASVALAALGPCKPDGSYCYGCAVGAMLNALTDRGWLVFSG